MSRPDPQTGPAYRRLILAIYLVAGLLHLWRYLCTIFTEENAIMGLMAQDLLAGTYPLFFYGQEWMGGLDSLLSAPLLALTGPTPWVINLWSPIFSLLTMRALHGFMARVLSPAGVVAGLIWLALPPALNLYWAGYAQSHVTLGVLLASLLLWQTAILAQRPAWGWWRAPLWGLLAGACVYAFPQGLVAGLACGGYLLFFIRPWPRLALHLPGALLGLAAGLSPILFYNLTRDLPYAAQVDFFGLGYLLPHLGHLWHNSLPIMLGFNTQAVLSSGAAPPWWSGLFPLVLVLMLGGLALLAWSSRREEDRLGLVPLGVAGLNLGAVLFTAYGQVLGTWHQAYLLPACLALPVAWGRLAQGFSGRRLAPALILGGAVALVHVAAYAGFVMYGAPILKLPDDLGSRYAYYDQGIAQLRRAGVRHVYARPSYIWSFLAGGDPLVSEPWDERAATRSFVVDAAQRAAFWLRVAPSLRLLGVDYQKGQAAGVPFYYQIKQTHPARVAIPRQNWQARDLAGADLGPSLSDANLTTGFTTPGPAQEGQGLELDLGREQLISGLALVPHELQLPAGLRLQTAGQDHKFTTLVEAPGYWGPMYMSGPHAFLKVRHARLEAYFAPRRARYLRLVHLGKADSPWSVREALLWGPGPESQPPSWDQSGQALLKLLGQDPPSLVYADAWPAALIMNGLKGKVAATPSNMTWDNYGRSRWRAGAPLPLEHPAGQALVVDQRQAALTQDLLIRAGVGLASRQEAGRLTLFRFSGWQRGPEIPLGEVSSQVDPGAASALTQGRPPQGRWTSQAPQGPGIHLYVDLGLVRPLGWLELENIYSPDDYARGLKAEVSQDGQIWQEAPLTLAGPLCFAGPTVFISQATGSLYGFPSGVRARFVRLSPTRSAPNWWSVERLRLWEPGPR